MLNFIKVWSFRLATAFSIVFTILYSIFLLISIPYGYFLGGEYADRPDWALQDIINSVLEVPYQEKRDFVIDRPEYIKTHLLQHTVHRHRQLIS